MAAQMNYSRLSRMQTDTFSTLDNIKVAARRVFPGCEVEVEWGADSKDVIWASIIIDNDQVRARLDMNIPNVPLSVDLAERVIMRTYEKTTKEKQ